MSTENDDSLIDSKRKSVTAIEFDMILKDIELKEKNIENKIEGKLKITKITKFVNQY